MKKGFKDVNKLFLVGCGIVILSVVVMVVMVLTNNGNKNKQLVCQSSNGNVTLFYNNDNIEGYTSNGYSYDMLSEQGRVEQIGIDKYIEEYADTFSTNTLGTCTIK